MSIDDRRSEARGGPAPSLATVVLQHETAEGSHYDWMIEMPESTGDPHGRLWTARATSPSRDWQPKGGLDLTIIGEHRRLYLTYEGPLTGGRGSVQRVDAGYAFPVIWKSDHMLLELELSGCQGRVEIRQIENDRWRATFVR